MREEREVTAAPSNRSTEKLRFMLREEEKKDVMKRQCRQAPRSSSPKDQAFSKELFHPVSQSLISFGKRLFSLKYSFFGNIFL